MKKLLAFLLVIVCIFSLVACNKEVTIRSIDLPPDVGFAAVIEFFYEDDDNLYYFPYPYSKALTVTYSNGESEPFDQALKEGRATIADLDRFGIKYYTESKNLTITSIELITPVENDNSSPQLFYEDDENKYYLPIRTLGSLWVIYEDKTSEPLTVAIGKDRATIADLDKFGIQYYTQPKNDSAPQQ